MPVVKEKTGIGKLDPHIPNRRLDSNAENPWEAEVRGLEAVGIRKKKDGEVQPPPTSPPLNVIAPVWQDLDPTVGEVISSGTVTDGVWSGNPAPIITKQYKRNGANITVPHLVVQGDVGAVFSCTVIATNSTGTVPLEAGNTNAVPLPPAAPANIVAPVWVDTSPEVGDVIFDTAVTDGTWSGNPPPTISKQFKKNNVNIDVPYTVVLGDVGATFVAVVTATNQSGSVVQTTNATTAATEPVPVPDSAPVNTSLPVWADTTPQVGDTIDVLSCSVGVWTGKPAPTFARQYKKNGTNISVPYTVVTGDIGATFTCVVTASNSEAPGGVTATSAATSAVPTPLAAPINTVAPAWTDSTPSVGDTITASSCSDGTWTGNPTPTISKQYRKNGGNITVPYTVVAGDVGLAFDCVVTASNSQGTVPVTVATSAVPPTGVTESTDHTFLVSGTNGSFNGWNPGTGLRDGVYMGGTGGGSTNSIWGSDNPGASEAAPAFIRAVLPSQKLIDRIEVAVVTSGSGGPWAGEHLVNRRVQYSNDGTNWTDHSTLPAIMNEGQMYPISMAGVNTSNIRIMSPDAYVALSEFRIYTGSGGGGGGSGTRPMFPFIG